MCTLQCIKCYIQDNCYLFSFILRVSSMPEADPNVECCAANCKSSAADVQLGRPIQVKCHVNECYCSATRQPIIGAGQISCWYWKIVPIGNYVRPQH